MITNFGNIKDEVIRRGGIATTTVNYTDAHLNAWIQSAHRWATAFKKWPFTEGRVSTTYVSGTEEWNFEGYKADSFRMLQIGGKRLQKLNFEDYQIFKEEEQSSDDRVWSDFGRLVFVNPRVDLSGTLTAYGQFVPTDIDVTDLTATTVFSGNDEEGNEAIVEEVLSYMKTRQQKEKEADYHHKRAESLLNMVWGKVEDEQFNYHTHRSRGGMFDRFNVLAGGLNDDLVKRNQFPFG